MPFFIPVLLTLCGTSLWVASSSPATPCTQCFVSPGGDDSGRGTLDSPYRTVQRGLDDVSSGVASLVNLLAGTYFLSATVDMGGLGLTPGSLACPPTLAAFPPGAAVTVSGGVPIPPSAFVPYTGGGGVGAGAVEADLRALGVPLAQDQCSGSLNGDGFFHPERARPSGTQLYDLATDRALTLASFPPLVPVDSPYTSIFLFAPWVTPASPGAPAAVGFGPNVSSRLAAWAPQLASPAPDVWAHGNWEATWADATLPVASWHLPPPGPDGAVNGSFTLDASGPGCSQLCDGFCQPVGGATFALSNLLAEVQRPGDYYINRTSGVVVAIPPSPTWAPVASALPVLFASTGGAANLVLAGLSLRHSLGQLVSWTNCTNCTLAGGSLAFAGAQCMNVSGGAGSGMWGASVTGCGVGGVFLDGGDRVGLVPGGHFVRASLIHDFNARVWDNSPGVMLMGVGGEVVDSELHTAPHQAVYAQGNNHLLARTHIHDVTLHACDSGAFYTGRDWSYRGNRVLNNTFAHIHSDMDCNPWFSVVAVYADDGASGLTVAGNSFINVSRALRAYGGRSHRIVNNTAQGVLFDFVQMDNLPGTCDLPGSTQLARLLAMPYNTSAAWLGAYSSFPDFLPTILGQDPCNNHYDLIINNTGCGVGGQLVVPHNASQLEAWGGMVSGNSVTSGACGPPSTTPPAPGYSPPQGGGAVGAWVYDVVGGQPAMWATDLSSFNAGGGTRNVTTIFSYGGDMEYYPGSAQPYQTYFSQQSQEAVAAYLRVPGVTTVVCVVDGRMDGGEDYSPDLSKLSTPQLHAWADAAADLYCSFDEVGGLQLDLEPFAGKYRAPFLLFLARLAANLLSPERNCASAAHPGGRTISTFMFAQDATPDVWAALGPRGYLVASGYDLSSSPPGTPSTVAAYEAALGASVAALVQSAAASNGSFFVGIPAAASAHEFATFTLANGTVVEGSPQTQYLQAALRILRANAAGQPGYLGPALWGFSSEMEYPPHSQNVFEPGNPFVEAGERDFLLHNL